MCITRFILHLSLVQDFFNSGKRFSQLNIIAYYITNSILFFSPPSFSSVLQTTILKLKLSSNFIYIYRLFNFNTTLFHNGKNVAITVNQKSYFRIRSLLYNFCIAFFSSVSFIRRRLSHQYRLLLRGFSYLRNLAHRFFSYLFRNFRRLGRLSCRRIGYRHHFRGNSLRRHIFICLIVGHICTSNLLVHPICSEPNCCNEYQCKQNQKNPFDHRFFPPFHAHSIFC